jgi:predicted Zn-dependent protease
MKRVTLLAALALLLCGAAALVWIGDRDERVDLSAAGEVWGDVLRDADQLGWQAARVPVAEETALGDRVWNSLSLPEDATLTPYVSAVGQPLLANLRRQGITYRFHVADWDAMNAFALPGGHIIVARGMLEFTQSEAELAAVLAHEISHVDLGHCAGLWRYQLALKRIGLSGAGATADLLRRPLAAGYRKYEETEADIHAEALLIGAGYDPRAATALFSRMNPKTVAPKPKTPLGEAAGAVLGSLGSYFDTHPKPDQRVRRINAFLRANQHRLEGRTFYRGIENRRRLTARSQQAFPGEACTF